MANLCSDQMPPYTLSKISAESGQCFLDLSLFRVSCGMEFTNGFHGIDTNGLVRKRYAGYQAKWKERVFWIEMFFFRLNWPFFRMACLQIIMPGSK